MSKAGATGLRPELWWRLRRVLPAFAVGQFISLGALLLVPAIVAAAEGRAAVGSDAPSLAAVASRLHYWDGNSYIAIAENGYPLAGNSEFMYLNAFLPGYPLLMRAVMVLGTGPVLAGLIISLAAECIALIAIDVLVTAERDQRAGRFAVWLVALMPFGVFLSLVYTESAFIAAAAVSLVLARQGRLGYAALAATAAASIRITGIILVPVLFVEWLRAAGLHLRPRPQFSRLTRGRLAMLPALALPVLPLVLFSLYLGLHSGNLNGFRDAQTSPSFRHDLAWPWDGFWLAWNTSRTAGDPETAWIFLREGVAGVAGLLACLVAWGDRRFPRSLALYCSLVWLVSTSLTFWLSIPRYLLAMFPLVIVVADLTARRRWLRPLLVTASAGIMTWAASIYAIHHWLA